MIQLAWDSAAFLAMGVGVIACYRGISRIVDAKNGYPDRAPKGVEDAT